MNGYVARPGDTVLIQLADDTSRKQAEALKSHLADLMPGVNVALLVRCEVLAVVRAEPTS
ncbi:hypothetical protein [Pseudonocardia pini]|uniref:hypothetical protein n=1 Tax=Pseudonocardia pini TaxID=2758030 RepID=UPI0015EFE500|nr:hypothetical protein [Pseudonocardia pini]